MTTGDVEIEIIDGGAGIVSVPASSVQVVIGPATSGTDAVVVATRSPKVLQDTFGSGPLPEAAALSALAGGTVLAMKAATNTDGQLTGVTITRATSPASTSVITADGTPTDEFYVVFLCTADGTIGSAGITFRISVDGGRNYGPKLALGTANFFLITGTGITLHFAAGTLKTGDTATLSSSAPAWDTGAVEACLTALQASQYAVAGWGSLHVVGITDGAAAGTFGTDLENMAAKFVFTRGLFSARDVVTPTTWGGMGGETEAEWIADVALDFSAVSAKRVLVTAGNYNMPSAFPSSVYGSPRMRRALSWALAAREVAIPPQRHAGRVRDGALSNIVIDPTSDPSDGFVYHDEFNNPGLEDARLCAARTRIGKPGLFISEPNLMAPNGSQFTLLPYGNVMDVACDIVHQVGQDEINEDIRLNSNGTIFENEALSIEAILRGAINANMTSKGMISSVTVAVDRTTNVLATSTVEISVTILRRGYVLQENVKIGFKNPFAAGG